MAGLSRIAFRLNDVWRVTSNLLAHFDDGKGCPICFKGFLDSLKGAGFDLSGSVPPSDCRRYLRVGEPRNSRNRRFGGFNHGISLGPVMNRFMKKSADLAPNPSRFQVSSLQGAAVYSMVEFHVHFHHSGPQTFVGGHGSWRRKLMGPRIGIRR